MRIVKFLEDLGSKPALTDAQYKATIAALDLGDIEREGLIGRDASKLNALLGGRAAMWCAVMTPGHAPHEDRPPNEPVEEPMQDEPDSEEKN